MMNEIIEVKVDEFPEVCAKLDATSEEVILLTLVGGKPMLRDRIRKLAGRKGVKRYVEEVEIVSVHPVTTIRFTLLLLTEDEREQLITCMEEKVKQTILTVQARQPKAVVSRKTTRQLTATRHETKMKFNNNGGRRRKLAPALR